MNTHAATWVERLMDGSFQKTKGALRDSIGHCCMGVGCELWRTVTGEGVWKPLGPSPSSGLEIYEFVLPDTDLYVDDSECSVLPKRVADWLGLETVTGAFERSSLTTINDEDDDWWRVTNIILRQPEGLFK